MIAINLIVNPKDHEKLDEWKSTFLWTPVDEAQLGNNIRAIQNEKVKSGSILVHNADGTFKTIAFRAKKINEPKDEEVIIRVKKPRKGAVLTFDEKLDMVNKFVKEHGRHPRKDESIDDFRVGTFYASLLKNRDKYNDLIDELGESELPPEEEEEEEAPKEEEETVKEDAPKPKPKGKNKKQ